MRFAVLLISILCSGCTEHNRAKNLGGVLEISAPCDQKVIGVTWKDEYDVWVATRPFEQGEVPTDVTFKQHTSLGLLEGTVLIHETLCKASVSEDFSTVKSSQNENLESQIENMNDIMEVSTAASRGI